MTAYETAVGKRHRVRYRRPDRSQTDKRGFRTKREAELFLASVEVSMARSEYVDATAAREMIGVLGAAWLGSQTHLKPSSVRPVEIAWRLHVGNASAAMTLDVYADLFDDDLDLAAVRLNDGLARTSVGRPRSRETTDPLRSAGVWGSEGVEDRGGGGI